MSLLHGFDISAYQSNTAPSADFVFVKASEGASYTSSRFAAQWASAKTRAKHRGAYHFARPEASSAASQAARFLAVVKPVLGESVWLDLEASDLSQSATNAWARAWGDYVRAHAPGVTSGIYMGSGYASNGTGKGLAGHFDYWWYPQYPSTSRTHTWRTSFTPWLPGNLTCGWKRPHIWQFTDNFDGRDASVSWLTLDQLAGAGPAPEEDTMISGYISGGKGEKPAIVLKPGSCTRVALAWDNTYPNADLGITRKPPAKVRLAMHQPGRKGDVVTLTVGASLTDAKGWADAVSHALPSGCDYIGVVREDDSPAPVGFVVY